MLGQCDTGRHREPFPEDQGALGGLTQTQSPGFQRPLMQLLFSPAGSPAWVRRVKASPSQLVKRASHSYGFQLKGPFESKGPSRSDQGGQATV